MVAFFSLMPFPRAPVHEGLALLGHHLGILLPHGLAEHVRLAEREAGQNRRDAHHLLLVGDDPVGVREDGLELRQLVLHLGAAGLARDEVVHHPALERAGPVERVHRNQVVEALRLGLAKNLPHARALELEDAVGLAVHEELIGLRVVERNRVDVEVDSLGPSDLRQRVLDERQRAEAEEVHLEQADAFDLFHRPLGRDFVAVALIEGGVVGDRSRRDDHAGGVDAGVARHALQGGRPSRAAPSPAASWSCSCFRIGFSASALASVMSSAAGICFAIRSTSA